MFMSYARFCNCAWLDSQCSELKPDGGSAGFMHTVFHTYKTFVSQSHTHLVTGQRLMRRHDVTWFHAWLENSGNYSEERWGKLPYAFLFHEKDNKIRVPEGLFCLCFFLSLLLPQHRWHEILRYLEQLVALMLVIWRIWLWINGSTF